MLLLLERNHAAAKPDIVLSEESALVRVCKRLRFCGNFDGASNYGGRSKAVETSTLQHGLWNVGSAATPARINMVKPPTGANGISAPSAANI